MNNLSGFYPALITPYTKNGDVHYESLKKLIDKLISEGVDGFYITGSTGECFLLSHEERAEVIRFVLEHTAGRVHTIVHVGSTATAEAVSFAKIAETCGADAISAVPPFYYKYSFEEIKLHYETIMGGCRLPMIVYNFPALSGVTFTPDHIAELYQNERLIGVKHTSMNLFELEQFKRKCKGLLVFNGHDEVLLGGLSMGADGAIGSTFNIIYPIIKEIYDAFVKHQMELAGASQQKANRFIDALIRSGVNQGIKYLLERYQEIECNGCRMPMKSISEESKHELDQIYKELMIDQ